MRFPPELFTLPRRHKNVIAASCLVLLGVAGFGGSALWRASRALRIAEEEGSRSSQFAFEARPLGLRPLSGVEYLAYPSVWKDAAIFRDHLYVCGPSGLSVYGSDGQLLERFRVGERLPAAPLTAMVVAVVSNSSGPELWIATSGEGLLAYDGKRFRHIRPNAPEHRKLTSIAALPSGRLLAGTEKAGVLAFDGQTLGPFHDRLRDFHVTALAADGGDVWAGTIDRGLLHWHGGQVDAFDEGSGLPDARVLSIAVGDGVVFAGTAVGVAEIRNGSVERIVADGAFATALHAGATSLLVGTHEDGVMEFPRAPVKRRRLRAFETAAHVEKLLELRGATYALVRDGLYDIRTGERVVSPEPAVLHDGNIAALAAEPNGRLWIGYFDRGLDIVEPGGERVRHLEDEHLFCVNRIASTGRGFAVATANGLLLLDGTGNKRQLIGRDQGLISNHVTDVAVFGGGLVAATPAGVTFIGDDGARSLYGFHGLVNNHVYCLGVSDGKLLAGTLGGLSVLEADFVKASYTMANSPLRHNWISAIARGGRDWFIGTYGGGVYRLDGDSTWHTFADMPAGIEVNPNAMASKGSRVYAGTLGRGLMIYDSDRGRWSTVESGLPSLNVTALALESAFVYIGTDNGIVRVKESEL